MTKDSLRDDLRGLLNATGQADATAAITYIAEGLFLPEQADVQQLIAAVVSSAHLSPNAKSAVQRLSRMAAKSELDTAEVLLKPEWLTPPSVYRRALDLLASKTSSGRLDEGLTARVVYAAQRQSDRVIDTLMAVAALSWRELTDRAGISSPRAPTGEWNLRAIEKAFIAIDDVVCGRVESALEGGFAARPIELLGDPDVTASGKSGWKVIEDFRTKGVPFEALLAQRVEGGAWRTHRDRIGRRYAHVLAEELCARFDAAGIDYRRAKNCGGDVPSKKIAELVGGGGSQVGVVVLGPKELPTAAIAISIANDGGSASKSGSKVLKLCGALTVPIIAVVAGLGWQYRNETADLAEAVSGQIYTERTLSQLVRYLASDANHAAIETGKSS